MARKNRVLDKDRGWLKILAATRSLSRQVADLDVGVLAGTPGGDREVSPNLKAYELATVLQLGTQDIPARPVLARVFDAQREKTFSFAARLLDRMLVSGLKVTDATDRVGEFLVGEVKKYIRRPPGPPPPNTPSTEARKGFNHPDRKSVV